MREFETIVIGAGPAGIGAITYLKRANIRFLWLEKGAPGGKLINIHQIANCPGFEPQDGFSLSLKLMAPLGISPTFGDVLSLKKEGETFLVETKEETYASKTVLLATGLSNTPKIPGEKDLLGHGVSYCATCDGPFYKEKVVALNGEGEKAYEEALYLSSIVKELHLFYPSPSFFNEEILKEKGNVFFHPSSEILKIQSEPDVKKVGSILYREGKSEKTMQIAALFPLMGEGTDTFFLRNLPIQVETGFIVTNDSMETNIPGLFAAGDIVKKRLRQVVTALSDGAIASSGIISYLRSHKE